MEKENKEKVDGMTVYELSYILLPSLAEEQVPARVSSLKDLVTQAGGAVISLEDPVLIDLAYSMTKVTPTSRTKVNSGYFGWIKFELLTEEIEKLKNKLDNNAEVVRYLLIKTVKENTLLTGKMNLSKEEKVRRDEEISEPVLEEVVKEATSEEVDKSIDELVVE